MAEHIMVTMLKALVKGKLGIGELSGKERFMLAQVGLPDRVPTLLAATNIEPVDVDKDYNYIKLSKSVQANLDLFDQVYNRINADQIIAPGWLGFMGFGATEVGTRYKIPEHRVPYPVEYPIKEYKDLDDLRLPEEASGYYKMYLELTQEAQERYSDMLITIALEGPWNLAMLLRGDHKLPLDMRIHKDYYESEDEQRRKKILQRGDPDFFPTLMRFCTQLSIRLIELAKAQGISMMGATLDDQYAAEPIMSRADYVKYVFPYIEEVWLSQNKKLAPFYPCPSPQRMQSILETESPIRKEQITWSNYIFHTTPNGITLPEYDRPAFELAKKYKKTFIYIIHGKYLRDASEAELEQLVKRVLGLAVEIGVPVFLMLSSLPPGTDLEKANFTFDLTKKYGRY